MPDRPLAIVTEPLTPSAVAWLGEQAETVEAGFGSAEFDGLIGRAEALVVRTYTPVDAALLDRAPNLRVVGRAGVALDNIDVPACRARGIEVVHSPGANSSAVVEYVFALLFDALRPRVFVEKAMDVGSWEKLRGELLAPRQLEDLTMGVWGCGRVGSRVCRAAAAFGMRAIYHDVAEIPPEKRWGAEPVDRETLLAQADVVTVHVDDRPANRGLVSADAFGRMKSDVVFLNCARGLVCDPVAAADFFVGHPAAIGLFDVHDPEPFGETYPLLEIKNVHLLPHIAAATAGAKSRMSDVVRDVWRVLSGEKPENPAPASALG